jgi:hypothetical protein
MVAAKKTFTEKLKSKTGIGLTMAFILLITAISIAILRGDGFTATIKHDGSEASFKTGQTKQ